MAALSIDEIVSDPNVRGGKPVIRGTGLRAEDIAMQHLRGDRLSVEAIAESYQLTVGQIHAALAIMPCIKRRWINT